MRRALVAAVAALMVVVCAVPMAAAGPDKPGTGTGTGSGKTAGAANPASAKELFLGLSRLPGLRARYREEKHLTLLVAPLASEGTVWFVPPAEFIRVTTAPVWSSLVVRPTSITYTDDVGVQKLPVGKDHPARAFVQVFVDVVGGDLRAIERDFVVLFTAGAGARPWELGLRPRKRDFAGVRTIQIRGAGLTIASLEIVDSAGDRTVTTFDQVDTARRPGARDLADALRRAR